MKLKPLYILHPIPPDYLSQTKWSIPWLACICLVKTFTSRTFFVLYLPCQGLLTTDLARSNIGVRPGRPETVKSSGPSAQPTQPASSPYCPPRSVVVTVGTSLSIEPYTEGVFGLDFTTIYPAQKKIKTEIPVAGKKLYAFP
jgi:hypothetical protein